MKFSNLTIENFMAIGSASISLADRGLLLIQGENRDDSSQISNGAGKSSIVDALCWALFGDTARGESGDTVVNRSAGKNCRVSVTIEDDGVKYEVVRHRKYTKKRNVLEVFKDGTDLTKGTDKLTQEVVNQILGCSVDVFRSSVYAGQNSQIDLPNMTDKFLKMIVEESAGITRLQNAHDIAKERHKEALQLRASLDQQQIDLQFQADNYGETAEQLKVKSQQFEEQRELEIQKLEGLVKSEKNKMRPLLTEVKAFDHDACKNEYTAIINKAVDEAWRTKQTALNDDVLAKTNELQVTEGLVEQLRQKLKRAKNVLANLEEMVGTLCSECGKVYAKEDLAELEKEQRKIVADNVPEFKKLNIKVDEIKKALLEAREALEKHNSSVTVSEEEKARRDALKSQLDAYQSNLDKLRDCKKSITDYLAEIDKTKAQENPHSELIEQYLQKQKDTWEEFNKLNGDIESASDKITIAAGVVEVFSNTGVRAHILDTVTPYLNERTAEYLSQLSDDNIHATWTTLTVNSKGDVREKFSIDVESKTGGGNYRSLSGGEQRKVRLATNMALQDLVASRASKPIDLYIGDEIDHALDVGGLERLMSVLEERARNNGTVLVISHNELSDWIPDTLTVIKDCGISTVSDGLGS